MNQLMILLFIHSFNQLQSLLDAAEGLSERLSSLSQHTSNVREQADISAPTRALSHDQVEHDVW